MIKHNRTAMASRFWHLNMNITAEIGGLNFINPLLLMIKLWVNTAIFNRDEISQSYLMC